MWSNCSKPMKNSSQTSAQIFVQLIYENVQAMWIEIHGSIVPFRYLPHLTGYDLNESWCHDLPLLSCDKFTLLPIQYIQMGAGDRFHWTGEYSGTEFGNDNLFSNFVEIFSLKPQWIISTNESIWYCCLRKSNSSSYWKITFHFPVLSSEHGFFFRPFKNKNLYFFFNQKWQRNEKPEKWESFVHWLVRMEYVTFQTWIQTTNGRFRKIVCINEEHSDYILHRVSIALCLCSGILFLFISNGWTFHAFKSRL